MIRRTSNTNTTSLAGTVAHLIATSGSLFFLLLISRDAYSSLARTGHARLRTLITQRIQRRATALVALLGFGDGDADAEVTRLTNAAVPVMMLSVLSCRPGGPREFVRWLDRRIEQALYGQPLDAPPSAAVPPRLALALRQLPIPIDGRQAALAEILRQLTTSERRILQYRTEPNATWQNVAARMGMTVRAARALHRRAMSAAQQITLDLEEPQRSATGTERRRAA